MKKLTISTVALLVLLSEHVYASVACIELPPVDDFVCNTQGMFINCRLEVENGLLKVEIDQLRGSPPRVTPQEIFACIEKDKKAIQPVYNAAKSALKANKDGLTALKDLYAYWLSSLDMLIPSLNESKYQYKAKVSERESGLTERGNKLKVEAQ